MSFEGFLMFLSKSVRALIARGRRPRRPRGPAARLSVESLEGRALPSSTALLVKDLNLAPLGSFPEQPVNVNGTLFFTADDGVHGRELWASDGTEAGTRLVKDLVPGSSGSFPEEMVAVGGTLFFSVFTPETGTELWKSDGTAAGTVL